MVLWDSNDTNTSNLTTSNSDWANAVLIIYKVEEKFHCSGLCALRSSYLFYKVRNMLTLFIICLNFLLLC